MSCLIINCPDERAADFYFCERHLEMLEGVRLELARSWVPESETKEPEPAPPADMSTDYPRPLEFS